MKKMEKNKNFLINTFISYAAASTTVTKTNELCTTTATAATAATAAGATNNTDTNTKSTTGLQLLFQN
jgi:hypothetical protein